MASKAAVALAAVLTFGIGMMSGAHATDCAGTVHNICDTLYPKDRTVESEHKYTVCSVIGHKFCSSGQSGRVNPTEMKQMVQQSQPEPGMRLRKRVVEQPTYQPKLLNNR